MDKDKPKDSESHESSNASREGSAAGKGRADAKDSRSPGAVGIPVIGLGGSAGALASFEAFFTAMPGDSGAAFVVIQHMSPSHESLLPELLGRYSCMQVRQAQDGMVVKPNCVYVIPPNHHLGIRNGALYLAEPVREAGLHLPIDFFFRSLAEDRAEKAIGILFSGAGADGTLGARAICAAGGLVLAQDPATAGVHDLPGNAKAAGVVDIVLPPGRMPENVIQYLRHPYVDSERRAAVIEANARPGDVQDILGLVLAQTGCNFKCYKESTVLRRIERRMGLRQMSSVAEYSSLLNRDTHEVRLLLRDLLIKVTAFFRDPEAYEELRNKALVPIISGKSNEEPLRVWVPGCATGEEAYSLAMLLTEQLKSGGNRCTLQVFATDVDEEALELARRGLYPESIAADVSPARLAKFFVRREEGYQIRDGLRKSITFAVHNLLGDPPFSNMDLISCRNLLIYLDTEAQSKLTALFNFGLKSGGYLFLGRSETVVGQNDLFETVSHKGRISRRLAPIRPLVLDSPILPGRKRLPLVPAAPSRSAASNFADVLRLELLRHFNASALLIDQKGKILQFHGQADNYLNLPATGPTFNALALARDRLPAKLRLAIHQAIVSGETVATEPISIARSNEQFDVRLTVTPVQQRGETEPLLVVFFEDVQSAGTAGPEPVKSRENETLLQRLEEELRETERDLQASIAELQRTNEDLRAANEEVISANEELQSTNEEMTSSTEELQATNEELNTVNSQLQEKIELLDTANADMANLLKSSRVATLFLDRTLRIKFFTPEMARMLKLTASVMGMPLTLLALDFAGHDLISDALAVARNTSEIETEVRRADGSSYLTRIVPYYTQEGRTDGVIVTFIDITRLRRTERRLAAIVESSNDAIYSQAADGTISTWNQAASRIYGYAGEEAIGRDVSDLIPDDRSGEIREMMDQVRRGDLVTAFETEHLAKDGRRISVSLTVSPIFDAAGFFAGASTISRNTSELWLSLEALRKSEERFRALVESSPNAVLLAAANGTITLLNRQAEIMFGYEYRELVGKEVEILIPERFRDQHPSFRDLFAADPVRRPMGAGRDLLAVRKDGSEFPVEIGLTPLDMPEGLVTMATITDISRRKLREVGG